MPGGYRRGSDCRGRRLPKRCRPACRALSTARLLTERKSTGISPRSMSQISRRRAAALPARRTPGTTSCARTVQRCTARHRRSIRRAAPAILPTRSMPNCTAVHDRSTGRRSLFRYFHGRSSLATWLRSVLAQRHIDRIRERRRLDPLSDDTVLESAVAHSVPAPERGRFVLMMQAALRSALAQLAPDDRLRLSSYYAGRMTLAQVGRLTGEHEATVSRQLARTRAALRKSVESALRDEHGLDEATITECFRSVADDPGPLDLTELLERKNVADDRSKDRSCA